MLHMNLALVLNYLFMSGLMFLGYLKVYAMNS